jgi:hypothetical protein
VVRVMMVVAMVLGLMGQGRADTAPSAPPPPEKRTASPAWGALAGPDAPRVWPQEDIMTERRICMELLARAAYDLEAGEPVREGPCGAPAPLLLRGLPGEPAVEIAPPATVTCGFAATLRDWVDRVLQPTARARLGSPIAKIRLMGSYSCRRRYNAPDTRISQHARAKAIDIAAFQTADGQVITVLEHWPGDDERAAFLRDVHTGACQIFDTVLGPRANAAHENHFHFDIGSGGVCE